MENTIILFPYAGQLTKRVRRESEIISRAKRYPWVQDRRDVQEAERSNSVVAINRQSEWIYGLATLAAVVVMAAALVTSFAIFLTSFIGL
jgi:hypothetical protein